MKRTAIVFITCALTFGTFTADSDAQRRKTRRTTRRQPPAPSGRVAIPCPSPLRDITDCPDTGCGRAVDPHLNRQKNLRSGAQTASIMTIQELKDLPDPVPGFKVGDTREKLAALGEGETITVEAYAPVVRPGSKESCNCGLTRVADTDNHIVLVDLLLRRRRGETAKALLHRCEADSITAEFAPRPRLELPHLTRANLKPLIDAAPGQALKVRVTGLLMFDSEHSLGHRLLRHNNWEIHPVLALDYCPARKVCTAESDDNWKGLEEEP